MDPKVSIIILNWNGWKDTIECLESLYQINYQNYNIILVDNNSENDSIQMIREYCKGNIPVKSKFFKYKKTNKPLEIIEHTKEKSEEIKFNESFNAKPKKLILIKNDKNYGFTEGNNIGIRYAIKSFNSDYILLLNNDTIVDKNFLNEMVLLAKSDKSIGFVGAKTYYYTFKPSPIFRFSSYLHHPLDHSYHYKKNCAYTRIIQSFGGKENLWRGDPKLLKIMQIDTGQFKKNRTVDFIPGACILTKKEVINEIGLLDYNFFSFREENDWCLRGWKNGWKSVVSYKSMIWHKEGRSTASAKFKQISIYYLTRNRFLFMKKHVNKIQLTFFLLYFFIYDFWVNLFLYLVKPFPNKLQIVKYFLKATKDGLNFMMK
jgi:GT2 family glycosyltransferase